MEEHESSNPIKKRNQLVRVREIILTLSSIFVAVFFTELYLHATKYPYTGCSEVIETAESYLGEYHPALGWLYKGNTAFFSPRGNYTYYFNEDGVRVPHFGYEFNWEKPKILFIGGSVTYGEQLPYEDTFPAQIKKLTNDRFEIINMGVQGYSGAQSLKRLEQSIDDYKPDYVVYTFIPDHVNRNINVDRRLHNPCITFPATKPTYRVSDGNLIQQTYPKRIADNDLIKTPLFIRNNYRLMQEKQLHANGKSIEISKAIIDQIATISQEGGAQVFYIYYDTIYDQSPTSMNSVLLESLFADQQERVLNLTNWAEDSNKPGTKYFVSSEDDVHPNASLSAEIARRFIEKFSNVLESEGL